MRRLGRSLNDLTHNRIDEALRLIDQLDEDNRLLRGRVRILDARERELDDQLNDRRLAGQEAPAAAIRVGSGWLEVKWIPRKGGKATGPYLYYRVREGGHLRSRYVGKASAG